MKILDSSKMHGSHR